MKWSKAKQLIEEKLAPALKGRVTYTASVIGSPTINPGGRTSRWMGVDIFNLAKETPIHWYPTVQDAKKDASVELPVYETEMESLRNQGIPEDRIMMVARKRKLAGLGDAVFKAQTALFKTDLQKKRNISSAVRWNRRWTVKKY